MSKAEFIEHNGERIDLATARVIAERRCDLCGEFIDEADALQVGLDIFQAGAPVAPRITLDAHPSCLHKLGGRIADVIDRTTGALS